MDVVLNIGGSLLLLLLCAALILPTAYAFAVKQRVRDPLQLLQVVLTFVSIAGLWARMPLLTAGGFAGVLTITVAILAVNAARRPKITGPSDSVADPAADARSSRPPSRS